MFIVTAYHFKHNYMGVEQRQALYNNNIPKIDLEDFVQIGQFSTDSPSKRACHEAFDYFNWVHLEFEAPEIVNDLARFYGTHASMSVGDIIKISGKCLGEYFHRYFICMPYSWEVVSVNK